MLTDAGARLGNMSPGGAVIIVTVIVVSTMLTQAFTFEAIRFLEVRSPMQVRDGSGPAFASGVPSAACRAAIGRTQRQLSWPR
jgi:hypothetical protein